MAVFSLLERTVLYGFHIAISRICDLQAYLGKNRKRKLAAGIGSYIGINAAAFCAAIEFGIQPLLFTDAAGKALYCPYPLQYHHIPAASVYTSAALRKESLPQLVRSAHLCTLNEVILFFQSIVPVLFQAVNNKLFPRNSLNLRYNSSCSFKTANLSDNICNLLYDKSYLSTSLYPDEYLLYQERTVLITFLHLSLSILP